jgi:hypothetical protein
MKQRIIKTGYYIFGDIVLEDVDFEVTLDITNFNGVKVLNVAFVNPDDYTDQLNSKHIFGRIKKDFENDWATILIENENTDDNLVEEIEAFLNKNHKPRPEARMIMTSPIKDILMQDGLL